MRIFTKFTSKYKFIFCGLFICWVIGMIYTVFSIGQKRSGDQKERKLQMNFLKRNHLPPPSSLKMVKTQRYCNPPENISLGREGLVKGNYSLELVAVLIRHGDRGPLIPVRNQSAISCGLQGRQNHPLISKYFKSLRLKHRWQKLREQFGSFPLYPEDKNCQNGELTHIGAMQHLVLGQLLGEVYKKKWNLLPEHITSEHFSVLSTRYSRTFQSALAFIFGFLPKLELDDLKVIQVEDQLFCVKEESCQCEKLDQQEALVYEKMNQLLKSHPAVVDLVYKLSPIVRGRGASPNITHVKPLFDALMAYVCHQSHLPCWPQPYTCATIDHVRNMISYLDWEGKQLLGYPPYRKGAVLKMYGLLTRLKNILSDRIQRRTDHRFFLFSGHDLTIEPLSVILNFNSGTIPPYASRVIFELYKQKKPTYSEADYVIRVLFNGKDVTNFLPFCKSVLISEKHLWRGGKSYKQFFCPVESFYKFMSKDFFRNVNGTDFSNACDLS
ncbi:2-phosphoxylose phosphatase 1-like [Tachypleus tridentatus]|uniref:2-phosphoxylose phosphatase 1-like n=1 Tax=Tachypleus tridentatus TaxID=6853 RepID=UPI003FD0A05E